MPTDGSAYATLGLEPGADAQAIDRAYKRLIKQFHPDREGGDARRAAEINRAYRELRDLRGLRGSLEFDEDAARREPRWKLATMLLLAGAGLLVVGGAALTGSLAVQAPEALRSEAAGTETGSASGKSSFLDAPIDDEAVRSAIAEVRRIAASGDEMALTRASRDCHAALRRFPNLSQLDRCAAFDDTVVLLQDRDPLRDQGPFSELAVTGRQMSSATLLSSDYLEIDGRLDRIRLKVELALAPAEPELSASMPEGDPVSD